MIKKNLQINSVIFTSILVEIMYLFSLSSSITVRVFLFQIFFDTLCCFVFMKWGMTDILWIFGYANKSPSLRRQEFAHKCYCHDLKQIGFINVLNIQRPQKLLLEISFRIGISLKLTDRIVYAKLAGWACSHLLVLKFS